MRYLLFLLFSIFFINSCSEGNNQGPENVDINATDSSTTGNTSANNNSTPSGSNLGVIPDSIVDERDGNVYKTVVLGEQVWLAENLRYLPKSSGFYYDDFSPMYHVQNFMHNDIDSLKASEYYEDYGVLYNWPAALTACPAGWHLPSKEDFNILLDYAGGKDVAGKILKYSNQTKSSESGFDARTGGAYHEREFSRVGYLGYYWSRTPDPQLSAYSLQFIDFYDTCKIIASHRRAEFSVRCLMGEFVEAPPENVTASITYGSIVDERDGNIYNTITIGSQTWMQQNLRYLPSVKSNSNRSTSTADCFVYGYMGKDTAEAKATDNYQEHGVLYNWPAASTACPAGWKIPTGADWELLERNVEPLGVAWYRDEGGFATTFGGYYSTSNGAVGIDRSSYWWTESKRSQTVYFTSYIGSSSKNLSFEFSGTKTAHYVRCILEEGS